MDRAKIGGTALPKLGRDVLANVLNACLQLYSAEALLLIRDEKISAVPPGDSVDYSILPINELLTTLKAKLDDRFPGSVFEAGYCDHSLVSASWKMPNQREELLGTYIKTLCATGKRCSCLQTDTGYQVYDLGHRRRIRKRSLHFLLADSIQFISANALLSITDISPKFRTLLMCLISFSLSLEIWLLNWTHYWISRLIIR